MIVLFSEISNQSEQREITVIVLKIILVTVRYLFQQSEIGSSCDDIWGFDITTFFRRGRSFIKVTDLWRDVPQEAFQPFDINRLAQRLG